MNMRIICLMLSLIICINVNANEGVWKIHSVFNENRTQVVDTDNKVYCVTDNFLNAYNKKSQVWEPINIGNRLSSYYVKNIYYNSLKKYLVVTYLDYNIDILLQDGTTVSIPDIKNMTIVGARDINDVTFDEGGMYVASKIGYIYIEDKNFTVAQASMLGENIRSVAKVGNKLLVATDSNVLFTQKGKIVNKVSDLSSSAIGITGNITPVSDNSFFVMSNVLYLVNFDSNNKFTKTAVTGWKVVDLQHTKDGFVALGGDNVKSTAKYYVFDNNGNKTVDITLPAAVKNTLLSSQEKDGALWSLSDKGLQKVKINASSSSVDIVSSLTAPNVPDTKRSISLSYNNTTSKLYVANGSPRSNFTVQKYGVNAKIMSYDGSVWTNEVPADMQGYIFQDPSRIEFTPSHTDTYYVGTWYDGVYKITDGKFAGKYDQNNSPLVKALNGWYCYVPCLQFDTEGNLWLMQCNGTINALPKTKVNKDYTQLTANDWKSYDGFKIEAKSGEFFVTKSGYKILYNGFLDGTLTIFSTDKNLDIVDRKEFSHFYNKEGKKVYWSYIFDIKEDLNGVVWVASSSGLFSFRPEEFMNSDFRVNNPIDRDNKYKYILESTNVMSISIDEYNRKWVGTYVTGLYLLNEDCSKVLGHYHSGNSCFPNDNVIDVCWNPRTQSVFVGLNGALLEYTPYSNTNVSDVKVYPSNITPQYKGMLKINNVPLNSTIYIHSKDGKLVKTLNATKSQLSWNMLTDKNKPLSTGKYYISIRLPQQDKTNENITTFTVIR